MSSSVIRKRYLLLHLMLAIVGVVFLYRLVVIQVVHGESYAATAESQYTRIVKDKGTGRSNIYFVNRDGERVSAAATKQGYTLAVVPNEVKDPQYVFERLEQVVDLDNEIAFEQIAKEDDPYEELKFRLNEEEALAIRDLHLGAVRLVPSSWRYYPSNQLAAQTIGFVGYDSDGGLVGRYGIERSFENLLQEDPDKIEQNIFASIFRDVGTLKEPVNTRQAHIVTTLDPEAQSTLEVTLEGVLNDRQATSVGGIILRPDTGEIIAMESLPTFDPNTYGKEQDFSVFQNPLVEHVFEMGSIIKPLVMAAAIDDGAVTSSDLYNDTGSVEVYDYTISNYDGKGRGMVTLKEVLAQSLNTGMVYIGEQIGLSALRDYFEGFKVTESTGIGLPNEAAPQVKNLEQGGPVELANITFGQGIAMSPLQVTRSLAVLANDGRVPVPYLVSEYETLYGEVRSAHETKQSDQVLSSETVEEVTRILVYAVDQYLNRAASRMPGYSVAAKTGTAQIPNPNGGYYDDRNLHSFFGYFPAYDPEFLVFLYAEHPQGVRYSSETWNSPFFDLAEFLVSYYDIPPDREIPTNEPG